MANKRLRVGLIEDIAAIANLDALLEVDHTDAFFVAPSDLATSMGHIGALGHREVQRSIDAAIGLVDKAAAGARG